MQAFQITEGIILKSVPYEDQKQILTLYTPSGIFSVMHHLSNKKTSLTPLTLGEFSLKKQKSSWLTLQDMTPINYYFPIRGSYSHLSAATECLKAILLSQLQGKPSPKLYAVLKIYLNHFMEFEDPFILTSSLLLKILRHEGLIDLTPRCVTCHSKELKSFHEVGFYCENCIPLKTNCLDASLLEELLLLGLSRTISHLKIPSNPLIYPFVSNLFSSTL